MNIIFPRESIQKLNEIFYFHHNSWKFFHVHLIIDKSISFSPRKSGNSSGTSLNEPSSFYPKELKNLLSTTNNHKNSILFHHKSWRFFWVCSLLIKSSSDSRRKSRVNPIIKWNFHLKNILDTFYNWQIHFFFTTKVRQSSRYMRQLLLFIPWKFKHLLGI